MLAASLRSCKPFSAPSFLHLCVQEIAEIHAFEEEILERLGSVTCRKAAAGPAAPNLQQWLGVRGDRAGEAAIAGTR